MATEDAVTKLGEITGTNDMALAKLIGFVMRELIDANPAMKLRLKARLYEVAMHDEPEKRELATILVKAVARSAGVRLSDL